MVESFLGLVEREFLYHALHAHLLRERNTFLAVLGVTGGPSTDRKTLGDKGG